MTIPETGTGVVVALVLTAWIVKEVIIPIVVKMRHRLNGSKDNPGHFTREDRKLLVNIEDVICRKDANSNPLLYSLLSKINKNLEK